MSETEEILDDMGDQEGEIELNNLPEELCIEFVDEYEEMSEDERTVNSNDITHVRSDKCSKCNVCFLSAAHYESHVGACHGEVIHKDDCLVIQEHDLSVQPKSITVNTTHTNDESASEGNSVSMKAKCNTSVSSTPVIAQHSKTANNLSAIYKCIKCNKRFLDSPNYFSHVMTCQGENGLDNSVKESSGLQVERYGCMHCTQCFTTLEDLEVHIKVHGELKGVSEEAVSKLITTTDPFDCEVRGKSFSHKENLELHDKTHTQPGEFDSTLDGNQIGIIQSCDQTTIAIKKTFQRTEKRVKSHGSMKNKAIQRKRQSSSLNKKIASQSIVKGRMHRPKVMPNRNRCHTCSQCKVSFSRAYTLTCHMRKKHSRNNITVCNGGVQKQRSSSKRQNNRHRIPMVSTNSKSPLHLGIFEKFPHACKDCNKSFTRPYTLKCHIAKFHSPNKGSVMSNMQTVNSQPHKGSVMSNMQTVNSQPHKGSVMSNMQTVNSQPHKGSLMSNIQTVNSQPHKGSVMSNMQTVNSQPHKGSVMSNMQTVNSQPHTTASAEKSGYNCEQCAKNFTRIFALKRHMSMHSQTNMQGKTPLISKSENNVGKMYSDRELSELFNCSRCVVKIRRIPNLQKYDTTNEIFGDCDNQKGSEWNKNSKNEINIAAPSEITLISSPQKLDTTNAIFSDHDNQTGSEWNKNSKNEINIAAPSEITLIPSPQKLETTNAIFSKRNKNSKNRIECHLCSKKFSRADTLKSHINVHKGIRPYCCDECSSCFTRANTLRKHKAMHRKRKKCLEELKIEKNMQLDSLPCSKFPSKEGEDFSCHECGAILASKEGLKTHIKLYTVNGVLQKHKPKIRQQPYGCPIKQCSRKFATQREQQRHFRYHSIRPYSCSQCLKMFRSEKELEDHMPDHIGQPPCHKIQGKRRYLCEECGRSFCSPPRLKEHQTNRKKPCSQKARCLQCGEWFIKIRDMVAHMKIHQTGTRKKPEIIERAYNCKECPESFSLAVHLKSHVAKFHPNAEIPNFSKQGGYKDEYLCSECGKCFTSSFMLNYHLKAHQSNKKELLCSECGKCFSKQLALYQHMKRHQAQEKKLTTEKKIVKKKSKKLLECNQCKKVFAFPFRLRDHIYSQHTGIKADRCKQCGKTCSSSRSLRMHMRFAHGVRGHWCPECGDSFTLRSKYLEHMKQHLVTEPSEDSLQSTQEFSKDTTNQEDTINAYICCQCGKGFIRYADYRAHMKRVHSGEKGFICIVCGKNFPNRSTLVKHLKTSHSAMDLFYWCGECEERFTLKPDLTRHLLQHGGNQSDTGHLLQHGGNQSGTRHLLQHGGNQSDTGHLLQHGGNQSDTRHLLQHGGNQSEERFMQNAYAGLAMGDMEVIKENGESFTEDAGDELNEMSEICPGCKKCFVSVADLEWHMKICQSKRLLNKVAKESSVPDLLKESNENGEAIDFSNRFNAVDLGDTYQNQTESRENIPIDRVPDRSGALDTPENQIESDGDISEEDYVMEESNLSPPSPHFEDHLSQSSQPSENHLSPPAQPFENPDGDKHLQRGDTLINGNIGSYDSDTEIEDNISESNEDAVYSTTQVYNCLECGASFSQNDDLQEHKKTHHEQDVLADQTESIMENLTENSMEGSLILKLFTCLECGEKFTKSEDLKDHKQIHANETLSSSIDNTQVKSEKIDSTSDIKYIRCEGRNCRKHFTERSAFNEHIQTHITETNRHLCTECGKCYKEKCNLKLHMFVHTGVNPYVCKKCGKQFHRRNLLKYHDKTQHSGIIRQQRDLIQCSLCNKMVQHLQLHIIRQHRPRQIAAPIQCALCNKQVQNIGMHMIAVHKGIKPFPCNLCEKRCFTETQLKVHMDRHLKTTTPRCYLCTECGKSYKSKSSLHFHMLSHTRVKFSCDKCEMKFANPDSLKKHMVKHTEKGPHLCEMCGKEFVSQRKLTKHMRTHEDIKSEDHMKHLCEECGRGFSRKSYLARHLLTHTEVRPHMCNICGKGYKSKSSLTTHMDSHSNNPKKHSCKICGKVCASAALLLVHRQSHLGSKDHTCPICGKSFLLKSGLTRHLPIHSDRRPFSCLECDKSFALESRLAEHMLLHSDIKPFSCSKCSKSFVLKSRLKEHLKVHSDIQPFWCEHCNKGFMYKSKLEKHVAAHSEFKSFSCSKCSKSFVLQSQLTAHLLLHSDNKTFLCTQCGKAFMFKSQLVKHKVVHSDFKPFSCSKCGKSFVLKSRLTDHLLVHSDLRPYSCTECDKSYKFRYQLERHKAIHSGLKPFSCPVCGKSFVLKSQLEKHKGIHSDFKPFSCLECGKGFVVKSRLTLHLLLHSEIRPFPCSKCSKSFVSKSRLTNHLLLHSDIKPFSCTECDKSFSLKSQLTVHLKVHSDIRPFSCKQCSKGFMFRSQLEKHEAIHSDFKPFFCPECGKNFVLQSRLTTHLLVHSDNKPFSCIQCGKSFVFQSQLTKHLLVHSGIKPFSCAVCNQSFTRKSQLTEHMNKTNH